MIFYFTKKYLLIALFIILIINIIDAIGVVGFQSKGLPHVILKSFILSGFVAGFLANTYLKWKNLWVLYCNLRIRKYVIITMHVFLFELISIASILLIQKAVGPIDI